MPPEPSASALSAATPPKLRVAIADDSDDLRELLAELVNTSPDMECVAQITLQRNLIEAVCDAKPDVLLLDLLFDGISSLPLLPQLKAANSHTRIVIHSGYDIDSLSSSALQSGAVAVIPKGGDPDELLASIRRIAQGA